MSASRKVVERRCLKLIVSDCSTFHLVLIISNVFQKLYRIGGRGGGDLEIFVILWGKMFDCNRVIIGLDLGVGDLF